jgi:hypothetical protein
VGAEKDVGHLEIVKNDLFDEFLLLFFQILTHSAAPNLVFEGEINSAARG